jgi:hypothetical protein
MLGIVLCDMIRLPAAVGGAKEFVNKLSDLKNMDWDIEKRLGNIHTPLPVLYSRKHKKYTVQINLYKTFEFPSPAPSPPQSRISCRTDEDLDDDNADDDDGGTRAYEHRTLPFGTLENCV